MAVNADLCALSGATFWREKDISVDGDAEAAVAFARSDEPLGRTSIFLWTCDASGLFEGTGVTISK